MVKFWDFCQLQ